MKNECTQTKTQALLQALNGTKEELTAFIESIPNDEEYQAYKAAHPEPDKKWQGMTREQKTEYLADLIMQLAEKERQKKHEQLKSLLGYQNIASKDCTEMIKYINTEQSTGNYGEGNECLLYLDAFNYGYIQGKRAKRARKRGLCNE